MPRVQFGKAVQYHVPCPPQDVDAATVEEALGAVFERVPRLRGYVLDDQGRLRQHVEVFVDGEQVTDRAGLSDPVAPGGVIHVMQALSGG